MNTKKLDYHKASFNLFPNDFCNKAGLIFAFSTI